MAGEAQGNSGPAAPRAASAEKRPGAEAGGSKPGGPKPVAAEAAGGKAQGPKPVAAQAAGSKPGGPKPAGAAGPGKPGGPNAAAKPKPAGPKPNAPNAAAGAQPRPGPATGPAARSAPSGPAAAAAAERQRAAAAAQDEKAREATEQLRELRRRRARKLLLRVVFGVVLPTLVATGYYGVVATHQYESVALFTVDSTDAGGSAPSLLGGLSAIPAVRDTLAVRDYILSRDMLARLDREHQFIAHYSDPSADRFSRFTGQSFEEAYEYYEDQVLLHLDSISGVMTITVRAFSAERAQAFAKAILSYGEERVNELSARARQDKMQFAQDEVQKAEQRLVKARQALLKLQRERGEYNPQATASSAMQIRTKLEGELAAARAELMQLKAYMKPDAPKVIAAEARVRSLAAQVAGEKVRLVSPKSDKSLSQSVAAFEGALVEKEFAEKAYESALASLEVARTEVARQHRYLATIAEPSLADESTYPKRWLGVLTVFVACFLLLGIGTLILAAVKEHARV